MREFVLLQVRKMFAYQLCRQPVALTQNFKLDQQTLLNVSRATTNRIETHDSLAGTLDDLLENLLHRSHLFIRRMETAIRIQIADHTDRRIDGFTIERAHVKLPFEMVSQ